MDNTFAFIIVSLLATCWLAFIYGYLYIQERELSLALWGAGWCLHIVRLVIQLWAHPAGIGPSLAIIEQLANLASGLFLMGGTYKFLDRRLQPGWPGLFLVGGAWICVGALWPVTFSLLTLPIFLFLGVVYIWTGGELLRSPRLTGLGKPVAGWAFILSGLHKLDYPLLRPLEWFAPWGYLISSILVMSVAMGILLVYFERNRAELRQRQAKLQAILENAALGIGLVDLQGRYIQVNRHWAEMLGYPGTELLPLTVQDVTHPEDRVRNDAHFQALLRNEAADLRLEMRFIRNDGSAFWGDLSVSPLRGADGRLEALIGLVTDISAQKEAVLALQASQRDLQRKTSQLEQLLETARRMTGSLNLTEVLAQIAQSASELIEADGCVIYRLEPDERTLTPLVAVDPLYAAEILSTPLAVDASFTGQAVVSRCARVFNDAAELNSGCQIPGTPQFEQEHVMAAPFIVDDQVLGAICLDRISSQPFDAADLALAETFAALASLALKNAQVYAGLQGEVEERRRAETLLEERSEQLAGAYLELQKSESRYRSLYEDSPISLWVEDFSAVKAYLDELRQTSPDIFAGDFEAYLKSHPQMLSECAQRAVVVDVNRATLSLYGARTKGELLGSLGQILDDDIYTSFGNSVLAVAQGQQQFEFRTCNRTLAGKRLFLSLHWAVLPGSETSYSRVLISIIDRTDRQRAEQSLLESEARYRSLFEESASVMLLIDPANGQIVDANAAACQYYGFEREALLTRPITAINVGSSEQVSKEMESARQRLNNHFNFQHRLSNGQVRHVEIYSGPIHQDGRELLYSIVHDVTARVQREHEVETIVRVTAALRPATTRAEILPVIVNQVHSLMAAQGVAIVLRDPETGQGVFELACGIAEPLQGVRVSPGEGIGGLVLASGEPYLSNDVRADTRVYERGWLPQPQSLVAVPLSTREETIGALLTGREEPFTDGDLRLLIAVGEIAASAIHRQSLTDWTIQHARNMAAVSALGRSLSETLDLEQIYIRLAEAVRDLVPDVATLFISRYDPVQRVITAAFGLQDKERVDLGALPQLPLAPPGQGTQSEVIHTRQPLIINDLPKRAVQPIVVGNPEILTQSAIYVPLLARDQIVGIFQVQSYVPNRFTQADADLLSIVANTAAIAIQNAELFAETGRRLQRLDALHQIDKSITTHYDLNLTLQVVLDQVMTQLGVDAAALLLENPSQSLALQHRCGFRSSRLHPGLQQPGWGPAVQVVLDRRPLLIPDFPGWLHTARQAAVDPNGWERGTPEATWYGFEGEGFEAYLGVPLIAKGQVEGVLELYQRSPLEPDEEWFNFLDTLARQAAIAIEVASLFGDLQRSNQELTLTFDTTLEGWAKALELRDLETENHSQRVVGLAVALGRQIGLSGEALVHLRRGALLHDIGKMGVPDEILRKPGKLDPQEWEIMRQHPVHAYQLLAPIPFLHPALDIPYCHHEKWDGSGYPRGLKGEAIPLAARIFALVDVWDALQERRPYREPWTRAAALAYLREQAGVHFDPRVVEAFFQMINLAPPAASELDEMVKRIAI